MAGPATAALVLGGLSAATGLASFGMGLGNAAKARRAEQKAARESEKLMEEAERKAEKNFYEGLNVPLDAFNRQYEQQLQQQQQGLQALQEGDARAVASGVGRIGALAGAQGEKTRIAMGEALYANNKMKADANQQVNQQLIDFKLAGAADQSLRAREQQRMRKQGMNQALSGLGSAISAGKDMINLYEGDESTRAFGKLTDAQKAKFKDGSGNQMTSDKILEQIRQMTPEQRQQLRQGDGSENDIFDYSQVQVGEGTGTGLGMYSPQGQAFMAGSAIDPALGQLELPPIFGVSNPYSIGQNNYGFNSIFNNN